MKIDQIKTTPLGNICIRENTDGNFHRRTLAPGDDITKEPQLIQDACNAAWTPKIIEAYKAHQAAAI